MTVVDVLIKKLYKDEEKVTVESNGVEVTCFAVYCPYKIEEGKKYSAEFDFVVFDEYEVSEIHNRNSGIEYTGKAFSYLLIGKLEGSRLNAGIIFDDENLLSDYSFLDGKYVQVKADRLDISFI